MVRLEDVLADPSKADSIRGDIAEGRRRLEQAVINYRFGMQMFGPDIDQVEEDAFIFSMVMTLIREFDAREPGNATLPLMFAIMAMTEMRKHDQ